jgi:DNA adenine methylase
VVDPILKWAGGKRSLVPRILSLFPADYKNRVYHEPFFGGGAVFFRIRPSSSTINDINKRLINFYRVVRNNPEGLIEKASQYIFDKETYYKLRDRFNQPGLSDLEDASLLLYLNKTAFNGLYRENSNCDFNVPFGSYANPTIVPKDRIRVASKILKKVDIFCTDFNYVTKYANEGDICYLDPPYQPISSTANFTSYSSDGFDFNDQIRLRDVCIELHEKGVYFVLSNSYVEEIIGLYEEIKLFRLQINTIRANRVISSKASTRGEVKEILVTNIPKELSIGKKSPVRKPILFYYRNRNS